MAQATMERRPEDLLGEVSTEEIRVQALWEGAWPTKLANTILPPFVVLLRITMGWIFAYAGFDKLINGFSAEGFLVNATKGSASGGTLASMMNLIKESRQDRAVARTLIHPYSLNPDGERDGPDGRDQQKVMYREDVRSWTAPFVMAGVNTKVVRRSHALAGFPYGRNFRYDESVRTGRGFAGWLKGTLMTLTLGAIVFLASFAPTRNMLQRFVLAKPGEGPGRKLQQEGFFNLMQIGKLPDGTEIRGRITGDQDPGYGSTSKMLTECAVCLAKDELATGGGSWTPAAVMAGSLILRLRENAGLTFELSE